jgi:hypothetical protein
LIGPLGFPRRGEYIGGRASSGGGPGGPHHLVARPGAGPRHPMLRLAPGPPPSLLWTSSRVRKNRNFGFCFIQF